MPPTSVASAVPSLPVLQAAGGPDPADAVRQELEEEVKRLSSRLNKGVLPPLPQPGDAPPHWETEEQQQAYVGRVIKYVAEAGKRKSKAQLFSYRAGSHASHASHASPSGRAHGRKAAQPDEDRRRARRA